MILHIIFKFGYGRLLLSFRILEIADHSLQSLDFGLCFCDAMIKTMFHPTPSVVIRFVLRGGGLDAHYVFAFGEVGE